MKPKRKILTLAAITALFGAGGCDLNSNVCVYGPPPDGYDTNSPSVSAVESVEDIVSAESAETSETAETAETIETFDPAENIAEPVYGPPISMDANEESAETSDTEQEE